jgi:hypothetical protein
LRAPRPGTLFEIKSAAQSFQQAHFGGSGRDSVSLRSGYGHGTGLGHGICLASSPKNSHEARADWKIEIIRVKKKLRDEGISGDEVTQRTLGCLHNSDAGRNHDTPNAIAVIDDAQVGARAYQVFIIVTVASDA